MAVVIIRSTSNRGHFRAGMKFEREAGVFDLTDEQLEIVRADPRLVVEDDATSFRSISSLPPPVADSSSTGGDSSKRPKR